MLVRPSWMWNDTVEQRWQCCSALAYFWLVGLNRPIHCRGFLWFIFRKCKRGKLSAWLTLLMMSKIFSSLDMTTVFLPSVWRMAARLRSSIIPLTHIQGNPGAVCWNSCWLFFFFLRKLEKKNQGKKPHPRTKLSNSVRYLSHRCTDWLSPLLLESDIW